MLSHLLTAWAELVGDLLVNDAGQPVPSLVVRYHGHALPDDMDCEPDGTLAVWWTPPMQQKGGSSPSTGPCGGYPTVSLTARWARCWTLPDYKTTGAKLPVTTWDADAGLLADIAELVSRGLIRASCPGGTGDQDSFTGAVDALTVANTFTFLNCEPVGPLGGVAGLLWRATAGLKYVEPSSS